VFGWIQEVQNHLSAHPDLFGALTAPTLSDNPYGYINRFFLNQVPAF
jgi:hypothetical protein